MYSASQRSPSGDLVAVVTYQQELCWIGGPDLNRCRQNGHDRGKDQAAKPLVTFPIRKTHTHKVHLLLGNSLPIFDVVMNITSPGRLRAARKVRRGFDMKVLVTGHRGYIGTVMVPMLLSSGHDVVGLDTDLLRWLHLR